MKLSGSSDFFFSSFRRISRLLLSQEGNLLSVAGTGAVRKDITHVTEHREQKQHMNGYTPHNNDGRLLILIVLYLHAVVPLFYSVLLKLQSICRSAL